jgi:uncharacterized protein
MRSIRRIALDLIIIITIISTIGYLYRTYGDQVLIYLFGEARVTIYINDLAIPVTIADDPVERRQGLSNVKSLPSKEGKLFIFEKSDYYGFWMKEMLFPIDIIWIDETMKIVHIEENVLPSSYPTSYNPPVQARFVLELNAFFVDTFRLNIGDRVTIPPAYLPNDLPSLLQK